MPHIRFRGTSEKTIAHISSQSKDLAEIVGTSADNFTFENEYVELYENGKKNKGSPFVEVLWFRRSQEIKDATAQFLTSSILQVEKHSYVTVIFRDLDPSSYYENGKHF